MVYCLDIASWRAATPKELSAFYRDLPTRAAKSMKPHRSHLVVRRHFNQAEMYAYLRVRFGTPNGFQNFLRSNDSDNLVHWEFHLKAGEIDVCIWGWGRDVHVLVCERMTDEDWKALILAIKADFARIGREKSNMMKSFEKYVVFQNKFVILARLCADLHATIIDAPPPIRTLPRLTSKRSSRHRSVVMRKVADRARNIYGDCLKLRLLTPIMAEAYLNMIILMFCKPEIRSNSQLYQGFVRDKIPKKLELLANNCFGFANAVDSSSDAYRDFLRVMNARNFNIHGNIDPPREHIETVYFEGKRPLFTASGDHLFKSFEYLETLNAPYEVIKDYKSVHLFLIYLRNLLSPRHRDFFDQVINDPFPGFEMKVKGVTKILPERVSEAQFPNQRLDEDLEVNW